MIRVVSRHPGRFIQIVVVGALSFFSFAFGAILWLVIGEPGDVRLFIPMVMTVVLVLFLGLNVRPEMELRRAFAAQDQAGRFDPNVELMRVRGWWPTNSAILKQLRITKKQHGESPTVVIVGLSPVLPKPGHFRDEPRYYRVGSYTAAVILLAGLLTEVALIKWLGVVNYEWWVVARAFDLSVCLTIGYLALRPKKHLRISPGLFEVVKPPPLFGSNQDRVIPIAPPQTIILRVMSPPGGIPWWLKLGFSPSITIFDGTTETKAPAIETNIPAKDETLEHLLNTLTSTVTPAISQGGPLDALPD